MALGAQPREYFHAEPIRLGAGSLIEPGNWGRQLRLYGQPLGNNQRFGDALVLARELAFDLVRAREFPDKPSCLASAFVFETEEVARQHLASDGNRAVVHVVAIDGPEAPAHRAGYNLIPGPLPDTAYLAWLEGLARAYWQGH